MISSIQPSANDLDLGLIKRPMLIFGGPYSNLQATLSIINQANKLDIPPENVICTGDIVAYCADPEATTTRVRKWGIHVVMGNCEESLAQGALDCGCGFEDNSICSQLSTGWYRFARTKVSDNHKLWMSALPRSIRFRMKDKRFHVIHGGVKQINRFVFSGSAPHVFEEELKQTPADVIIGGHCGIPFYRKIRDRHWINAGVIGMPANDGTSSTWYLLLEPNQSTTGIKASWHRLAYDHEGAAVAMKDAGLITPYADTLSDGLWPSLSVLPEKEKERTGSAIKLGEVVI